LHDQVPPMGASDKDVVKPEHTVSAPEIAPGPGLTVSVATALQPVDGIV